MGSLRLLVVAGVTDLAIGQLDAEFFKRYAAEVRSLISAAGPDLLAEELAGRTTDVIAASNGVWLNCVRFKNRQDLERGLQRCEAIALETPPA